MGERVGEAQADALPPAVALTDAEALPQGVGRTGAVGGALPLAAAEMLAGSVAVPVSGAVRVRKSDGEGAPLREAPPTGDGVPLPLTVAAGESEGCAEALPASLCKGEGEGEGLPVGDGEAVGPAEGVAALEALPVTVGDG